MAAGLRILYDGWPLLREPSSPSALHLWAILEGLAEEITPIVALPDETPPWLAASGRLLVKPAPHEDTPRGRLAWEQKALPRLAREAGASLLHITHDRPAILASGPTIASPTEPDPVHAERGFVDRLRRSLGRGALAKGGMHLLWPSDLSEPEGSHALHLLPPVVHPDFGASLPALPGAIGRLSLPDSFILYHGSFDPAELRTLFDAWTWGAGAVGDYYPLLLLGGQEARISLNDLLDGYSFGEAVRLLPPLSPPEVPALYRKASALIHPGTETPWGGAIRHALACGLPVVTTDIPRNSALTGPAAFTIAPGDSRKLGAALITVIVEEEVAQKLSQAGRQRAAGWSNGDFRVALARIYRDLSARL
jgi:hypothetical protein